MDFFIRYQLENAKFSFEQSVSETEMAEIKHVRASTATRRDIADFWCNESPVFWVCMFRRNANDREYH